ncbi:1-deoxy-D-xylulose-5-phosphate reductoisomerase [Anaerotignum propionicum]|uniref:1-deoxy-D-xylulose 5-phosphate reductoisomerase n=1 Tax=Anaerotignum propionicum DSM 1682 TaxID=991789 RepID=A0A0X1U8A1_ANAPI|nr:1-deoxy-D-xylulose-5-phosphate reductoisomerase [Anaerotignum propionicum]AMJ41155.1 1-deoxy-D-xylulose 5-phosphate reductoisomerase [Anaerotignum propionicum DSM 1682]SHE64808.1 1-deoxy-D-xylulose 5-phosphate reductoisomerase [[Clostridium] propionicum DSM 1682] [Anaerotignum propionicum DSM 1682]
MREISILGSTGSIGTQTLEVIENIGDIKVSGISGNHNIDLLEKQARKFQPRYVAVMDENRGKILQGRLRDTKIKVLSGMEGLISVATLDSVDTVVTSVVGNVGLKPTFDAISAGKNIALANKETLVSAGQLVMDLAKKKGISIYPVDSEHSAIFQSLQGNEDNPIRRILLTASGGPFRGKKKDELMHVSAADALKHPNWSMGRKITIDSATLMNKGLEVMEAKWLFDVSANQIEVLVHPQSIMHSAVEYEDGAIIAQMGEPDMKVPIQYALTYPKRKKSPFPKVDFTQRNTLTFEKPDMKTFRCLELAYRALEIGGTLPAVLNGANEIAVDKFLNGKISFLQIPELIELTMNAYTVKYDYTLEDLLEADDWAKNFATGVDFR